MGAAGAAGASGVTVAIGLGLMVIGVVMFAAQPLYATSSQDYTLGGGADSTKLNTLPVIGIVMVVSGAIALLYGLAGARSSLGRV